MPYALVATLVAASGAAEVVDVALGVFGRWF